MIEQSQKSADYQSVRDLPGAEEDGDRYSDECRGDHRAEYSRMKTLITLAHDCDRLLPRIVCVFRHCEAADFTCVFSELSSWAKSRRFTQILTDLPRTVLLTY